MIGVYRNAHEVSSCAVEMSGTSPRTVCVSRRKTFIAEGSETIFVMYISTALNTSIAPVVFA